MQLFELFGDVLLCDNSKMKCDEKDTIYFYTDEDEKLSDLTVAMLSITYFIIGSQGMNETNLQDIMKKLGYTYNVSTSILNDGTKDYSIYDLLNLGIRVLCDKKMTLTRETMMLLAWTAHNNKDKSGNTYITDAQYKKLISIS